MCRVFAPSRPIDVTGWPHAAKTNSLPNLPAAVAAGQFGVDENNRPIRPKPDEVRAITETFAENLVELLRTIERSAPPGPDHGSQQLALALAAYAEDFGEDAARRLEVYIHFKAAPPR